MSTEQRLTLLRSSSQVTFRTFFGASVQLWNGGASICVENKFECIVQIDKDKRFVDMWMRSAPSCLGQVLEIAEKVSFWCGHCATFVMCILSPRDS